MSTTKATVSHTVSVFISGSTEPITLTGNDAINAVWAFTHGQPCFSFEDEGCTVYVMTCNVVYVSDCVEMSSDDVSDDTCPTEDNEDPGM